VTEKHDRPLGFWSLLALGINGIVGVGIFFAPKELAASAPGWGSLLVLAVTGFALLPVALAVSKIGSRIDEDGGPVVYARFAFGETAGFVVGWLAYVSAIFSACTVMVGLTNAVLPDLGKMTSRLVAVGLVTVLALICATGVKITARVWSALTVLKLVPLVFLAYVTLTHAPPPGIPAPAPVDAHIDWFRVCLKATFVFQGFEIVPVIAGQAKSSSRTIPPAVIGSLASATLIYLLLQRGAIFGVADLAHSGAPLVATAEAYAGKSLGKMINIGTSVSALGIAFGMVATTPRYLSALATHTRFTMERRGVPLYALGVTWLLVAMPVLFFGDFGDLLTLSSLSVVTQYLIVALALARFAWTGQRQLKLKDAWSSIPTILVALALLSGATWKEWGIAIACVIVGLALRMWHLRASAQTA
jgi:amino acid transporter